MEQAQHRLANSELHSAAPGNDSDVSHASSLDPYWEDKHGPAIKPFEVAYSSSKPWILGEMFWRMQAMLRLAGQAWKKHLEVRSFALLASRCMLFQRWPW